MADKIEEHFVDQSGNENEGDSFHEPDSQMNEMN